MVRQDAIALITVMSHKFHFIVLASVALLLSACVSGYQWTTDEHRKFELNDEDLRLYGIAFITPSSITGREQDRQSLALTFAEVLHEKQPDIRVVSLPETLSAVNQCGCLAEYKAMFDDYELTGIFQHTMLKKVAEITNTRYIAQLKLAGFEQSSSGRFDLFGLRLIKTNKANLRVFLQLWDSQSGAIVWEGYEEMDYAYDTYSEKGVMFYDIARAMAENMFANINGTKYKNSKQLAEE